MTPESEPGGILQQLENLYREREILDRELGVSDALSVVALVRSMESQLCDLYATLASTNSESEREING